MLNVLTPDSYYCLFLSSLKAILNLPYLITKYKQMEEDTFCAANTPKISPNFLVDNRHFLTSQTNIYNN